MCLIKFFFKILVQSFIVQQYEVPILSSVTSILGINDCQTLPLKRYLTKTFGKSFWPASYKFIN